MNQQTLKFLKACDQVGLKRVVIKISHPLVPESQTFCFGPNASVFGLKRQGAQTHYYRGWPAIWEAVRIAGINDGAGNSNQHQITPQAQRELDAGAYQKKNGKWVKLTVVGNRV